MEFTGYQMALPVKDLGNVIIPERDERGMIIKNGDKEQPLTVKNVIRTALTTNLQSVQEDEKQKFEDYRLASKILNALPEDKIELSSEDISQIKKKVSYCWGIEVYGFIVDLLEGRNKDWAATNDK